MHMLERLRRADVFQTVIPVGIVFRNGAWSLRGEVQRRSRGNFRSSVTWLSDLLSTLRSDRYQSQRKTRFWPLVRRCQPGFPPGGSLTKVSDFNSHRYHPPLPSFLAQSPFSSLKAKASTGWKSENLTELIVYGRPKVCAISVFFQIQCLFVSQ